MNSKHLLLIALLLPFVTLAQDDDDQGWDVNSIPGEARTVEIDTTSGTWMSLDVSPDGKTIAFDMLGDIYTVPVTGGDATNINSGLAWAMQPRFSPQTARRSRSRATQAVVTTSGPWMQMAETPAS